MQNGEANQEHRLTKRTFLGGEAVCKTADWKKKNAGKTSCDEFPFASTAEADGGKQIFRCAEDEAQDSQGAQINNAGKSCQKRNKNNNKAAFPCKFTLSFKGEDNFKYVGLPLSWA